MEEAEKVVVRNYADDLECGRKVVFALRGLHQY